MLIFVLILTMVVMPFILALITMGIQTFRNRHKE